MNYNYLMGNKFQARHAAVSFGKSGNSLLQYKGASFAIHCVYNHHHHHRHHWHHHHHCHQFTITIKREQARPHRTTHRPRTPWPFSWRGRRNLPCPLPSLSSPSSGSSWTMLLPISRWLTNLHSIKMGTEEWRSINGNHKLETFQFLSWSPELWLLWWQYDNLIFWYQRKYKM